MAEATQAINLTITMGFLIEGLALAIFIARPSPDKALGRTIMVVTMHNL